MVKVLCIAGVLAVISLPAAARDDRQAFPIAQALSSAAAQEKLKPNIRFFFGNKSHPKVVQDFGEWKTNKKTNAFAKTDQKACEWVFVSAMIALQDRATKEGANAVINISSNYKNIETRSASEYVCGAGGLMAGVALKGRVVRLGK